MVLDFVDDLGADPSGNSVSDGVFDQMNSIDRRFQVSVPQGDYTFSDSTHELEPEVGCEIKAELPSDPTFVAPGDYSGIWIDIEGKVSIEGIDIDRSSPGASPRLRIRAGRFASITDMALTGRDDSDAATGSVFDIAGTDSNATVVLDSILCKHGSLWSADSIGDSENGGRPGVRIGSDHYGQAIIENSTFREFSGPGIDGYGSQGTIEINECESVNNNVAQIRVGSPNDSIEKTIIGIDPVGATTDTALSTDAYTQLDGVRFETTTDLFRRSKEGATVDRCVAYIIRPVGSEPVIGSCFYGTETALTTRISRSDGRVDSGGFPAVRFDPPYRSDLNNADVGLDRFYGIGDTTSGRAVSVAGRGVTLFGSVIERPGDRTPLSVPSSGVTNRGTRLTLSAPVREVGIPDVDLSATYPDTLTGPPTDDGGDI